MENKDFSNKLSDYLIDNTNFGKLTIYSLGNNNYKLVKPIEVFISIDEYFILSFPELDIAVVDKTLFDCICKFKILLLDLFFRVNKNVADNKNTFKNNKEEQMYYTLYDIIVKK